MSAMQVRILRPALKAPFVYRPVRHVLSVKRAVQLRYGVLEAVSKAESLVAEFARIQTGG
jgi:hypothetical protein